MFSLKSLIVAAVAVAAVVSAAPAVDHKQAAIEYLKADCPGVKIVDHGDWAEASCELPGGPKRLSERGDGHHYWSNKDGWTYVAQVQASWNTHRSLILSGNSWDAIRNQPKRCTGDGAFCFDIIDASCIFYFANNEVGRSCNNWSSTDFVV
ncbi:hypothetical protein B0O80DRAFT_3545 [Mortierella sp. GBAus27b]|nr:hypothetical protein B0O80DRAFT_3545 [Mortierella sp. GBAus27b]